MKKKLLATVALTVAAITLVVASVLATVAYLSSSSAVSNTFTVGNVGITMFESYVNRDGERTEADRITPLASYDPATHVKSADGNSYHLVNGKSYIKDPTIYIDGSSDDCYVFIKTRNQIRDIEDGNVLKEGEDETQDALTMREQLLANGWIELYKTETHEYIYCFDGDTINEAAANGELKVSPVMVDKIGGSKVAIDLFENFTIDPQVDLSKHGGAKVTITAFAIQAKGFNETIPHEEGSIEFMKHLWNVVSGEFSFENVIIPDHDITSTTDADETTAPEGSN